MEQTAKITLLGVQVAGLVISALLVAVTFANPQQVEERLRSFAIAKVDQAAAEVWSQRSAAIEEGGRLDRLMALSDRFGVGAEALEAQRQEIVPALLALSKSQTCQKNCEFWVVAAAVADSAMIERAARMRIGQTTLGDFVVDRYETSVQGLLKDLRRFGLVNVVVFSLMIGLVLFRNHLNWRFTAFSVALTAYAAWAAYGYVFGQNWALTILFQNWAAPGYQGAMIFVALLFFDWLFLDGFVTEWVGNIVSSILPG